jgi:hypothetical protein
MRQAWLAYTFCRLQSRCRGTRCGAYTALPLPRWRFLSHGDMDVEIGTAAGRWQL